MNSRELEKFIDEYIKVGGLEKKDFNLCNIIFDIYEEKKEGAYSK